MLLVTPLWAQDFKRGVDAYMREDYATALEEFRALAELGSIAAQNNLGLMYARGHGVTQNYQEARSWYVRAARQSDPVACYNLGLIHLHGQGVPPSNVEAYKWFALAFAFGNDRAQRNLHIVAAQMPAGDIAEANSLVSEWLASDQTQ